MDRDIGITLRDAASADIEQIADIWRHYVSQSIANLEEIPPSTDEVRQTLEQIFTKKHPFIVATKGTTICGYAYIGPFNDRSGYRYCCEDTIYLLPAQAGKGLGKRMLETLIQRVKAETMMTQVLAKISISPSAALEDVASCRLHQSLGFKEVARLRKVGFKFQQWLDVVMLQLDLEDARYPNRP